MSILDSFRRRSFAGRRPVSGRSPALVLGYPHRRLSTLRATGLLQAALAEAGIGYRHHKELAPTTELRRLQYAEDARQGVGKRSRVELAAEYRRRYVPEILDRVELAPIVESLPSDSVSAFLCVERDFRACHRSLITDRLADEHHVSVSHLQA